MVLAAHDVAHAQINVVDHTRQQIEPAAVGPADDWIADQRGFELLRPAHQIVPHNRRAMLQPKPPVRCHACRDRRVGGLALIDRRQSASEQHFAPHVEFLGRLVTGIDPSRRTQLVELAFIKVEPLRLPKHCVGLYAQPVEIVADRLFELDGRPLAIGIVDPQQETPVMLQREQRIVQCGPDIPDMQPPGR